MSDVDLTRARELAEKAHQHVCDIAEGKTKWTMRIPADENRDSDLVISNALAVMPAMADEIERLRLRGDKYKGLFQRGVADRRQLIGLLREANRRIKELETPEPWDGKANAAEVLRPWKTATDDSDPLGFRHRDNPDVPLVIMPVARLNRMLHEHVEMGAKAAADETVRLVQELVAEDEAASGEAVRAQ